MELIEYIEVICKFLKDYLISSHQDGYVLGISGGVDSSVCAALIKKAIGKEKLHCLLMPIDSLPADLEDGLTLVKDLDLSYNVIDMSKGYHEYLEEFTRNNIELDASTRGNLKARMRMASLYAYGQAHRCLVVGTDNMDESYVGYFTKYGDGGVDLLPIVYLTKSEVREVGRILGIRDSLVNRIPSAGLYEGQTDEKEMGITYQDLDDYLLGKEINIEAKKRIQHLHNISEHKRVAIPRPMEFKR